MRIGLNRGYKQLKELVWLMKFVGLVYMIVQLQIIKASVSLLRIREALTNKKPVNSFAREFSSALSLKGTPVISSVKELSQQQDFLQVS